MASTHVGTADAASRILQAAETLFAAKGYDAVSLNLIASSAAVSKANIFHHFRSKSDLYFEVLRNAAAASRVDVGNLPAQSNYHERLAAFARQHLRNYVNHPTRARLLVREFLDGTAQIGQLLTRDEFARNFDQLVNLLKQGQRSGQLRDSVDPDLVATLIIAANVFYFRARVTMRQIGAPIFDQTPDAYSDLITEIILRGIRT